MIIAMNSRRCALRRWRPTIPGRNMVHGQIPPKAQVILELRVPDAAHSTHLHPERLSSTDAVSLAAIPVKPFTTVPAKLNTRVDFMASAVRLRPSTIMDLPSSHRMAPQQHCLFGRTRRHFAVRLHLSTKIIMGEDPPHGSHRMDPRYMLSRTRR